MIFAFYTLGCKVNQYETEAMAEIFRGRGHEIVDEEDFADVYVVNTCTVTAMADRKSRQFIRRMKKKNPHSIIAVTGCYVQIDPESVEAIEGVDIITGINEKGSLPGYVEELAEEKAISEIEKHILEYDELGEYEDLGIVTSSEGRTRAYIKVEDGCNRFCSYCVIPYARGAVRSRALDEIVDEAKTLISKGYREIVLTGINTALYGHDSRTEKSGCRETEDGSTAGGIETVIAALNDLDGDFRIRLSSLEPAVVDAEYVSRLLKYDRLCHHMHLSAQSGSDAVLSAMNRPYTRRDYEDIVRVLRDFDPCYGISTDIIVGFPGEKAEDHEDNLNLVRNCCFCRTHVFRYSKRPKTAAAEMKGQISPDVKNMRSERLQECADLTAEDFFLMNLGRTRTVLVEENMPEESMVCGYTDNYIRAYIPVEAEDAEKLVNGFIEVKIGDPYRDGVLAEVIRQPCCS